MYTKKEGNTTKLYLHVYLWKGSELFIPGILNAPEDLTAHILGADNKVKIESHKNGIQLSNLPKEAPFLLCTIIELNTNKELILDEGMYIGEEKSTRVPSIYARTEEVPNYDFSLEIPRSFWQEVRHKSKVIFPIKVYKSGVYNIYLSIGGNSNTVHSSIDGKDMGTKSLAQSDKYDFKRRLLYNVPLEATDKTITLDLKFSFPDTQYDLANLASVEFEYLYPNSEDTNAYESIYFYPNPAKNEIYIPNNKIVNLSIYSMNGTLLLQEKNSKFDISLLKKGIYIIKIETPENTIHTSLIKE